MATLIAFRAIQGFGAGSILTVSLTIVGDAFTVEERPKVQGSLTTVWGIASLVGPFLGGFLIDVLSWHWIFFINIPFGLLAVILLQRSFNTDFRHVFISLNRTMLKISNQIEVSCCLTMVSNTISEKSHLI
jgi:MFS family permease